MGRNPAWLNQKQVEVLRWVEDGCPIGGDEEGYERRITARALERRGLVAIKGHGASWSASITKAGLAWLAARPGVPPTDADVDELICRVQAGDGRLVLPDGRDVEMAHEQLVKMSEHSANRPKGWRLEMRATGPWAVRRKEIILVRHFEDLVDEVPVRVPSRVPRYHPTVKAFLADRDRQLVSKEHLARGARLLQAIVDEAPRRGLKLLSKAQATIEADAYTSRAISRGHLVLGSSAGTYAIRIQEVSARSDKTVEPRRWGERRTRPTWLDARTWEFVGSGVLELVVEGPGMGYGGDRHRDAKTISVEAKLPRVFRAIEIHRLYAELREQERQREAADRQRRWEAAMAEARRRYDEQARWDEFQRRSRDWHAITGHREFLAAVRGAVEGYRGSQRDDLVARLDFAERRLDESDPIKHLELLLPEVPDPQPDDLKPFLGGLSPHGPTGW
jgi:hypothetical protein